MIAAYTNLKINAIFTNSTALYSIVQTVLQPHHHLTFVSQSVIIAPTLTVEKNVESVCCAQLSLTPFVSGIPSISPPPPSSPPQPFHSRLVCNVPILSLVLRSLSQIDKTNEQQQTVHARHDDNALAMLSLKTAVTTNKSMNVLLLLAD